MYYGVILHPDRQRTDVPLSPGLQPLAFMLQGAHPATNLQDAEGETPGCSH